jgi:hypothetical protein
MPRRVLAVTLAITVLSVRGLSVLTVSSSTVFIDPGAPWQNPFVESFHSRMRDELLNLEEFYSLTEARVVIADWREDYNTRRPHSSLGMLAPAAFAASWTNPATAAA